MNLDSILTTNYSAIRENRINNVLSNSENIEKSFFMETVDFLREYNSEIRNTKCNFYKAISESTSQEVLTESFSSLFESFKKLLKKFLEFIKSLFSRFILKLHQLVGSDKYIIKNKDKFKDFRSDYEFDIEGYNFTFKSDIPIINVKAKFDKDFLKLDFDTADYKSTEKANKDTILTNITDLYDKYVDNSQDDLDSFRAECIGEQGRIDSEDFPERLFEIYRNDSSDRETITVTGSVVQSSLVSFKNYKEFEKSVKKTKDKIEKEYDQIKKSIERLVHRDTTKGPNDTIKLVVDSDYNGSTSDNIYVTNEIRNKIDLYIKAVCDRVIEYSSIHSLAFSSKLDAIKDRYMQDKKILYGALNQIYKLGYKEEFK